MNFPTYFMLWISMTTGNWIRPAGWLDRLVQYHKQKFVDDVRALAPINIKATIEPKPQGYVDSTDWDFKSVMRLIALMRKSKESKPAVVALRRMLGPTRRFMSKGASYHYFPSLFKDKKMDIYYDIDSGEMYMEEEESNAKTNASSVLTDNAIIFVSNPVESRLPSTRISVALLKEILEKRAEAARQMPTTTKWTVTTKAKSAAQTTKTTTAGDGEATGAGSAATDAGAGGTGASEAGAAGDVTATPAAEEQPAAEK